MLPFTNSRWVKVFLVILALLFLALLILNNLIADFFLQYIVLYKYTALFLVVFLGGLCVPLPVNVFLLAVGALGSSGQFDLKMAIIVTTVANVVGNMIAHSFFRKYGHDILRDQYIQKYSFFLRLEEFFKKYTSVSIFISRNIGLFGTPVNFLSGYFKVSHVKFTIFDILGNFTYAVIFLGVGFWVGEQWVVVSKFMNVFMNILAVVMLVSIGTMLYKTRKETT